MLVLRLFNCWRWRKPSQKSVYPTPFISLEFIRPLLSSSQSLKVPINQKVQAVQASYQLRTLRPLKLETVPSFADAGGGALAFHAAVAYIFRRTYGIVSKYETAKFCLLRLFACGSNSESILVIVCFGSSAKQDGKVLCRRVPKLQVLLRSSLGACNKHLKCLRHAADV